MEENSREDIQKVEKLIKKCDKCKLNECINCEVSWTEVTSIKKLTDEYKRVLGVNEVLLKENEELKDKYATFVKMSCEIVEQSIPVKKVKDKIEELDEELEIMKIDNMYSRYKEYGGKSKWERLFATKYGMHDALQELLEREKIK